MNYLFIICPECCNEREIEFFFGGKCYFVTCLGSILKTIDTATWEGMNNLVQQKNIQQIIIAQSLECCFLETGAYSNEARFNTKAEKNLIELKQEIVDIKGKPLVKLKEQLCELNIERSLQTCLENSSYINNKYQQDSSFVKGAIIYRSKENYMAGKIDRTNFSVRYLTSTPP